MKRKDVLSTRLRVAREMLARGSSVSEWTGIRATVTNTLFYKSNPRETEQPGSRQPGDIKMVWHI